MFLSADSGLSRLDVSFRVSGSTFWVLGSWFLVLGSGFPVLLVVRQSWTAALSCALAHNFEPSRRKDDHDSDRSSTLTIADVSRSITAAHSSDQKRQKQKREHRSRTDLSEKITVDILIDRTREQHTARRARCKFFALRVDLVFTSRDVTVTLKICFQ